MKPHRCVASFSEPFSPPPFLVHFSSPPPLPFLPRPPHDQRYTALSLRSVRKTRGSPLHSAPSFLRKLSFCPVPPPTHLAPPARLQGSPTRAIFIDTRLRTTDFIFRLRRLSNFPFSTIDSERKSYLLFPAEKDSPLHSSILPLLPPHSPYDHCPFPPLAGPLVRLLLFVVLGIYYQPVSLSFIPNL